MWTSEEHNNGRIGVRIKVSTALSNVFPMAYEMKASAVTRLPPASKLMLAMQFLEHDLNHQKHQISSATNIHIFL